jgi:hypothetical protein
MNKMRNEICKERTCKKAGEIMIPLHNFTFMGFKIEILLSEHRLNILLEKWEWDEKIQ